MLLWYVVKKPKLFDVCEIHYHRVNGEPLYRHLSTPYYNKSAALCQFYTKTLKPQFSGVFYIFVPNGKNPIQYLKEKKKGKNSKSYVPI